MKRFFIWPDGLVKNIRQGKKPILKTAIAGIAEAAVVAVCAVALVVFAESAAQPDELNYADNDPRFQTAQPCRHFGGTVIIFAEYEICKNIDQSGTFCIVGSKDAFPCRGLYKHVAACNQKFNRAAVDPFFCGKKCSASENQRARGKECVAEIPESPCATPPGDAGECVDLIRAAEFNDATCARSLIDGGMDVDEKDARGRAPLHYAAWFDSCHVALLLLENDADVDAIDADEWTPLHNAALNNALAVASLLLENDADVHAKEGDDGGTPLHHAALSNASELVLLLLENDADVNAEDEYGDTPLDWATYEGLVEMQALLRDRGGRCGACYFK